MYRERELRDAAGATFAEEDVARSYRARPPYAPAVIQRLIELSPMRRRVLDIGCGPGVVAIPLADHFDEVVALDPSAHMLAEGRAADAGRHSNICWIEARAEAFDSDDGFDLITAGTSIHWPDHAVLFPKLAGWTETLAVIGNAELVWPCGEEAGLDFLKRWLQIMADRTPGVRQPYNPTAFAAEANRHERWMEISGRERFPHTHRASLGAVTMAQHSQATWSRAAMGEDLVAEFDRQLAAMLSPYVEDGMLELRYVSTLTWGAPRLAPS